MIRGRGEQRNPEIGELTFLFCGCGRRLQVQALLMDMCLLTCLLVCLVVVGFLDGLFSLCFFFPESLFYEWRGGGE
jgi:hypothetical protein